MSVFADQRFLDDFLKRGRFPDIHAKVGAMIRARAAEPEPFIDLGACVGLLSAQALSLGRSEGHALEGNPAHLERAVQLEKLSYLPIYVVPGTLEEVAGLIRQRGVTLCLARRVLSEIDLATKGLVPALAGILHDAGIKKLILQGRVPVKGQRARLCCTDDEIAAVGNAFDVRCQLGDVALLQPR